MRTVYITPVAAKYIKKNTGILANNNIIATVNKPAEIPNTVPAVKTDNAEIGGRRITPIRNNIAANDKKAGTGPRTRIQFNIYGGGEIGGETENGGNLGK